MPTPISRPTAKLPRLLLAATLCASLAAVQTACHQGPVTKEKGKLLVCLFPNFQPFVGKDAAGKWSGWDVDYLQSFAKLHHLELVPVETTEFDGIWNQPGLGRCDIAASGISDLEARRKETGAAGKWSATYYSVLRAFAARKGTPLTGLADLDGHEVIVTAQSTADLDLVNRIACADPKPNIAIRRTNDEGAAAKEVTAGTTFAYGGGLGSIQDLAKPPEANLEAVWPHCFMNPDCKESSEPFSFVVRAESKGLPEALDAFINAGQGGAWDYQGNVEKRQQGGDPVTCPR